MTLFDINHTFVAGQLYKLSRDQNGLANWAIYLKSGHLFHALGNSNITKRIADNSIILCLTNITISATLRKSYTATIRFLHKNEIIWMQIDPEQNGYFLQDWELIS